VINNNKTEKKENEKAAIWISYSTCRKKPLSSSQKPLTIFNQLIQLKILIRGTFKELFGYSAKKTC
jgi:hypothetical protein